MSKRYNIQAKRKNTDEPWSEWTSANHYCDAERHAVRVQRLGYDARIAPNKAVKKLWEILNNDIELTDKILDAGFCLKEDAVNSCLTLEKIERTE